ncbi:MAG: hypothetical protein JWM05_821 [Acidimicrobiales bacterium]|nr:hypothetical protein [Acidimicrobiales bacterium]
MDAFGGAATVRFPHTLTTLREVRHWLIRRLQGRRVLGPRRLEETLLMTSELVTNVLEHTESDPEITVTESDEAVRVEVRDDDPNLPEIQPLDPTRIGGNGLRIVDVWSEDWGVRRIDGDGKVVWFLVPKAGKEPAPEPHATSTAR